MYCPKCNTENPNGVSYCVTCGTPLLATEQTQPQPPTPRPVISSYTSTTGYQTPPANPAIKIKLAEGEKTIKGYLCTYYKSKIFGLKANGNLIVTNKRIIFHAQGSAVSGNSIIQSEIPVENVAGLTSFKGNSFTFWTFLGVFLAGIVGSNIVATLISTIRTQSYDAFLVVGWILAAIAFLASFYFPFQRIWRSILVFLASALIGIMGSGNLISAITSALNPFGSLMGNSYGSSFGAFFMTLIAAGLFIYGIVCTVKYSFRPVFSLNIIASNGNSAPISIGNGLVGFSSSAASRALTAEPAQDSEKVVSELGALILDIQKMGDLAIEKWKHS